MPSRPYDFPGDLWPRAVVVLSKLIEKFPNQTHLSELCEHIATEMTPVYCEAVETGKMKADSVLTDGSGMEELLRVFLIHNDPSHSVWDSVAGLSNQAWEILQRAKAATWGKLAEAIAEVQQRSANRIEESPFRAGDHQADANSAVTSGKRGLKAVELGEIERQLKAGRKALENFQEALTPLPEQVDRNQRFRLTPLEKLPLSEGSTELSLRFGTAWQVVKELRQILQTKKTQNTPDLVNREQELIQLLWREHSTVAEELELPRINDLAKGARDTIHDMPRQGRRARAKPQGRPSHRAEGFVSLAASLWRGKITKGKIVTDAQLASVALDLDAAGYTPPAEFLEGQAARKLRTFNSSHANSRVNGPISTWVELVQRRDKDFIRAMRRLLSRCASKCPETLSGQKKSSL